MVTPLVQAEPFDETRGNLYPGDIKFLRPILTLPQREMTLDEYILALASASKANFLADATDIPSKVTASPFPLLSDTVNGQRRFNGPRTPTFGALLEDFTAARQLSKIFFDPQTVLLWNAPDTNEMGRLIVEYKAYRPTRPASNRPQLYQQLSAEYERRVAAGAKLANNRRDLSLTLSELPAELRESLIALAQYEALRPQQRLELPFGEIFWRNARIRQGRGLREELARQQSMYISGRDENGERLPWTQFRDGYLQVEPNDARDQVQYLATLPPQTQTELLVQPLMPSARGLSWEQLNAEKALAAPIAMECTRRDLSQVLIEVGAAHNVKLVLQNVETAPKVLLTAKTHTMPVADFLSALARLYGLSWTKVSDTEFHAAFEPLNPLQKLLRRTSNGLASFRVTPGDDVALPWQEWRELTQEIVDDADKTQLRSEQGLAISELSPDLQERLRAAYRSAASAALLKSVSNAHQYLTPNAILDFGPERVESKLAVPFALHFKKSGGESIAGNITLRPPLPEPKPEGPPPLPTEPQRLER